MGHLINEIRQSLSFSIVELDKHLGMVENTQEMEKHLRACSLDSLALLSFSLNNITPACLYVKKCIEHAYLSKMRNG